jgi:uncharacterized protein
MSWSRLEKPAILPEPPCPGKPDAPHIAPDRAVCYGFDMKLHLNADASQPLFTGYAHDHVLIGTARHESSLLLSAQGIEIAPWAGLAFEALTVEHFAWIAKRPLDIVLFGTGTRLRFPHPSLTRALVEARIGLEVMDIGALCRTYNILAAEGRKVGAAVLIEPE